MCGVEIGGGVNWGKMWGEMGKGIVGRNMVREGEGDVVVREVKVRGGEGGRMLCMRKSRMLMKRLKVGRLGLRN